MLLWLAVLLLTCGFLSKVQTAYLFYGVAFIVLCADRDARRFLLGLNSIAAHATALAALLAWNAYFTHGAQSASTVVDITLKLNSIDLGDYLNQLWAFPVETVLRFLPVSAVAIYFGWRTRHANPADALSVNFPWRTLLAMLFLNYLPLAGPENPHPLHHAVVSPRRARTRHGCLALW
jgi:hypothetical protein